MATTYRTTNSTMIRSGLLIGVIAAFWLDMNSIVAGPQIYIALALLCLYRRDELAMLTLIPVSVGLLFVAGQTDTSMTLTESLAGSRGTVGGSLLLLLGSGLALLRSWARQEKRWHQLAQTDPLTGLANRRRLDQALNAAWEQSNRYDDPLSVLMLDLDHFKTINDDYGHARGDKALEDFAKLVGDTIRGCDQAGRYGGEEFLILCPSTEVNGAMKLAERIRSRWEKQSLRDGLPMTVSIGVAATHANSTSPKQVIDDADLALYRAKEAGRNRCRAHNVLPPTTPTGSKPNLAVVAAG